MNLPTRADRAGRLVSLALLALLALALTGCDAWDAALGDTDGDGRTSPQAVGDGLRGEPEDWLETVCGDGTDVATEEPENDEYSATQVELYTCTFDGADVGDTEVEEYEVEAALYTTDPHSDLVNRSDGFESGDGTAIAWAYGETADGWAVVWLIPNAGSDADLSLLDPLQDLGFETGQVH